MATRTARKKSSDGSIGRTKPLTPKTGVTRSSKRRYDSGGKIKK